MKQTNLKLRALFIQIINDDVVSLKNQETLANSFFNAKVKIRKFGKKYIRGILLAYYLNFKSVVKLLVKEKKSNSKVSYTSQ
jgi:hypothetical protein